MTLRDVCWMCSYYGLGKHSYIMDGKIVDFDMGSRNVAVCWTSTTTMQLPQDYARTVHDKNEMNAKP